MATDNAGVLGGDFDDLHHVTHDNINEEKNSEVYYVSEEDDVEDNVRCSWKCLNCPLEHQCTKNAWGRANCWSMESPDKMLCYVKWHLMHSNLHNLSGEDATVAILEASPITVRVLYDSWEDREQYRKALAGQKARQEQEEQRIEAAVHRHELAEQEKYPEQYQVQRRGKGKGQDKGKGKGKGQNKGKEMVDALAGNLMKMIRDSNNEWLQDALVQLQEESSRNIITMTGRSKAGDRAVLARGPEAGMYTRVSVENLKTIRANLRRGLDAIDSGITGAFKFARTLKEEWLILDRAINDVDMLLDQDAYHADDVVKVESVDEEATDLETVGKRRRR